MTTDAGSQEVPPEGTAAPSDAPTGSAVTPPDGASTETESPGVPPGSKKRASKPGSDTKKRTRPQTIAELFEHAYREEGRKLNMPRDLTNLAVDSAASQAEIELVRRLAADDPMLAVPPNLLATLAEVQTQPSVHERVLELVLVAFASHSLFRITLERLADPHASPPLTAREINSTAKTLTFDTADRLEAPERRAAIRERLRVNAVTAFELFRVLRDGWTSEQFVDDMCALIWDAPIQRNGPRAAALLATSKNTDALSQLARHFELLLQDSQSQTAQARGLAAQHDRRAAVAEARSESLNADLEAARSQITELKSQADDLEQRLSAEQNSRAVDTSHLVDDYQILRTQIIRQLTAQVELLSDGLHALRKGRTAIADESVDRALSKIDIAIEFVDRALSKIEGEVKRLKQLSGGTQ